MPRANDLWSFAQAFYAEPGVSEACLSLQDRLGVDVCLILHLLHLAMAGRTVSAEEVAELDSAARPWRESVVVPLRALRRGLRQPPAGYAEAEALRKSLGAQEIEAERMQLTFLEALAADRQSRTQDAVIPMRAAQTNFAAYRDLLNRSPDATAELLAAFGVYVARRSCNQKSG